MLEYGQERVWDKLWHSPVHCQLPLPRRVYFFKGARL